MFHLCCETDVRPDMIARRQADYGAPRARSKSAPKWPFIAVFNQLGRPAAALFTYPSAGWFAMGYWGCNARFNCCLNRTATQRLDNWPVYASCNRLCHWSRANRCHHGQRNGVFRRRNRHQALVVSVAAARPLAALAAPYVMDMPPGLAKHSVFRSTMAQITLIAALYYLISASFDVWLLQRSSVEGFVLLRFLASWPLAAAALVAIATVARSRLQQIPGVISVSELIERRMSGLSGTPKAS